MEFVKIIGVASVLLTGFFPACSNSQSQAVGEIRRMQSEKYFIKPLQLNLVRAIESENLFEIEEAIKNGADVNGIGVEDMTPLMWALLKDKKKSFSKLLEKGANPNYLTGRSEHDKRVNKPNETLGFDWGNSEVSVMEAASIAEDAYYLRLAIKHGGNPNMITSTVSKETILFESVRNRRSENIKMLLKSGANINHRNKGGITPVMAAHHATRYDMIYLLIQLGADLSLRSHLMTPDGLKKNQGWTLGESISKMGDGSIRVLGKEKEQREWYNKVVAELKRRGLM